MNCFMGWWGFKGCEGWGASVREWNGDGESRYGFGLSCSKSAGNGAGQEAGCQNSR